MNTIQYVDIHGQPISEAAMQAQRDIAKQKSATKLRQKNPDDKPEGFHKGCRVIGFSPEQIQAAREARERGIEMAKTAGSADIPPPFNLETFLKTHKGRPARTKPFELHASALECKALAERYGWINVEVVALCKGVGND